MLLRHLLIPFPFSPQAVAGENENRDVKAPWLPGRISPVRFGALFTFVWKESFWKTQSGSRVLDFILMNIADPRALARSLSNLISD